MHKSGIFHRDIKPENILIKGNHLVVADLGSCKGIYSKQPYTEYVSTRWYRAPECIMTEGIYTQKMDMWGIGCVLFEICSLFPLFPGENEIDQMYKIERILGPPNVDVVNNFYKKNKGFFNEIEFNYNKKGLGIAKYLGHCSNDLIDLINKLLCYNPDERFSAKQALNHVFFKELNNNNDGIKIEIKIKENWKDNLIKSDDSVNNKKKKNDGIYLPEVNKKKHNNSNFFNNSSNIINIEFNNISNEEENNYYSKKLKLPLLNKIRINFDKNNSILENNNSNIIINKGGGNSMSKKMNILKQKYISPYSQKAIYNNSPQRHNN
jgi:renal tumor antigen